MNKEVDKIQSWLLANKLSVHYTDKSLFMLINKNNNISVNEPFDLQMGGHQICRTKSYCYLGILVDEKLSWIDHINDVCSKLAKVNGIIFKIRSLLNKQALMLVYHSLVGSKLRYGLICWATASKSLINKIDVAHNNIVTTMTFSKRCSRMWPLYCQLKVLPLNLLIQIEYGKTVFKFNHKLLPPAFDNYFKKPSHHHGTRFSKSNNFAKLRISTAKEKSLLKYICPNTWNNIPLHIKESMSLKVFIKSYRNHLIGNYEQT